MKQENKNKNMTRAKQESTRFYCKEETKKEQGYDKKTYPKLMLNKLKVIGNFTFIYTYWALNSKKFFKKLSTHMWPMFTHV
jgi:hypothetical protein